MSNGHIDARVEHTYERFVKQGSRDLRATATGRFSFVKSGGNVGNKMFRRITAIKIAFASY
jgi:hypothetical protein